MSDLPPDWAFGRVQTLTEGYWDAQTAKSHKLSTAFAHYIAEHEEAPVDPLLPEAREIAAEAMAKTFKDVGEDTLSRIRSGEDDNYACVASALAALRRGIEIGKSS